MLRVTLSQHSLTQLYCFYWWSLHVVNQVYCLKQQEKQNEKRIFALKELSLKGETHTKQQTIIGSFDKFADKDNKTIQRFSSSWAEAGVRSGRQDGNFKQLRAGSIEERNGDERVLTDSGESGDKLRWCLTILIPVLGGGCLLPCLFICHLDPSF